MPRSSATFANGPCRLRSRMRCIAGHGRCGGLRLKSTKRNERLTAPLAGKFATRCSFSISSRPNPEVGRKRRSRQPSLAQKGRLSPGTAGRGRRKRAAFSERLHVVERTRKLRGTLLHVLVPGGVVS